MVYVLDFLFVDRNRDNHLGEMNLDNDGTI